MNKILNKNLEVKRNFSFADLRAIEEGIPHIIGHAAVFEEKTNIGGYFDEVILRGAFDNTNFDDVMLSTNHEIRKIPLARSRRNNSNSTMELKIDEKGLYVRANLDIENNTDAKAVYSAVNRGDMDGMSFIFLVEQERWEGLDTDKPIRYIEKIKRVREVSVVNFPAYSGTDINARDTLDNEKTALDNARSQELDNSSIEEVEKLKLKIKILAKGKV